LEDEGKKRSCSLNRPERCGGKKREGALKSEKVPSSTGGTNVFGNVLK